MKSIFTEKDTTPTTNVLKKALANTFPFWQDLSDYARELYPTATEGWNFSGIKYGWSFRISDKKRVILYLLPRDQFFKVAFVFGQKATEEILKSDVAENIKIELKNAKVYAEGRGIRIDVKDGTLLNDLKQLIEIKIKN